jgi:hypothetical protein
MKRRQTWHRCLVAGVLVGSIGCTASWDRVVRYSPEPAHAPASVEVYRAVLADLREPWWRDSVAIQASDELAPLAAVVGGEGIRIPGHWVDSLQRETRAALDHTSGAADPTALGQAARDLGLVLLPSDTTEWPTSVNSALPRMRLSRPGFNADSTIAALRVDYWCGFLCGASQTLLLARRPGLRWRVWYAMLHWVS